MRRLVEAGADAIKILLYYDPDDTDDDQLVKHAFIERVGAECRRSTGPSSWSRWSTTITWATKRASSSPRSSRKYVTSHGGVLQDRYGVDVLKVEVPVNMRFVEGTRAYGGQSAYTRQEALELFRQSAAASRRPFIYLSAGVTDEVFRETLELAAEAGTPFSGVLCGRATWQDGIPVYATQGAKALEAWLEDRGVAEYPGAQPGGSRARSPGGPSTAARRTSRS